MKISDDLRKKIKYIDLTESKEELQDLRDCLLELIDEINGDRK